MHKATVTAQIEVSEGKVTQMFTPVEAIAVPMGVAPIEDAFALVHRT